MNYFKFHIGDYARSTRHLSNDEDLAYRRLIDMYYETEAPIPLETQWVARRIRLPVEVVEIVLQDMFQRTDDGWKHARCEQELAEYHRQVEKNRLNGKRGGRPKTAKKNPVGSEPVASPIPDVTLTTNHKPLTINQDIVSSNEDKSSGDDLTVDDVVSAWNELAEQCGLAKVVKLSDTRRKHIRLRIKEYDAEDWSKAMGAIYRSSFLRGDNERGWKADFDFLLQPKSFLKLVEGSYDR